MSKKTIFFVGIAICLFVAGSWAYYLYQKPRASVTGLSPQYRLTAAELYGAFNKEEAIATQKMVDKIIAVKGTIESIATVDSALAVQLASGNESGGINCRLAKSENDKVSILHIGQLITIKGKCTGYLMDVNLVDGVIVN